MAGILSLETLPMTLVSGSILCFAIGYFSNTICNSDSPDNTCTQMTGYATTIAAISACGAVVLFCLMYMGYLAMPRGGMMGMGGYGGMF